MVDLKLTILPSLIYLVTGQPTAQMPFDKSEHSAMYQINHPKAQAVKPTRRRRKRRRVRNLRRAVRWLLMRKMKKKERPVMECKLIRRKRRRVQVMRSLAELQTAVSVSSSVSGPALSRTSGAEVVN